MSIVYQIKKRMSIVFNWLSFIGVVFLLKSCTSSQNTRQNYMQSSSEKDLYVYNKFFQFDYQLRHLENATQLLFNSTTNNNYRLELKAFTDYAAQRTLWEQELDVVASTRGEIWKIDLAPASGVSVLQIIVKDAANREVYSDLCLVNPLQVNTQSIFVNNKDNQPILNKYCSIGESIQVLTKDNSTEPLIIKYFKMDSQIATPAFMSSSIRFNPLRGYDSIFTQPKASLFSLNNPGFYFIQLDSNSNKGIFFNVFKKDFPKVKKLDNLVGPLRYITKDVEYRKIKNSTNPRRAFDQFWLNRGANKEKVKRGIKLYYNRVQRANHYFTSYKEGWKTDRGMIYILFGTPSYVHKLGDREQWFYLDENEDVKVEFTFKRTGELYTLLRSGAYKRISIEQLSKWRSLTI